jgi:cytochrome c peroxidase
MKLFCVIACFCIPVAAIASDPLIEKARTVFGTLTPPANPTTAEAELGRSLFWDPRISADGRTACASCHSADDWSADRRTFSPDARGRLTARNSQPVFNSMAQPFLRWTGDRKDGAHQAEKSLTGSMGFAAPEEVTPLLQKFGYEETFRKIWGNAPTPHSPRNYALALQAYQATLITPSKFDRILASTTDEPFTAPERRGLEQFLNLGCADCHKGPLLGGTLIRKFGIIRPYPEATGSAKHDAGLFETTKNEADRDKFRVSMLRNIARTAPYFHDGSAPTLSAAIKIMADTQLGETLTETQTADIAAFLATLTGEIPANYVPSFPAPR